MTISSGFFCDWCDTRHADLGDWSWCAGNGLLYTPDGVGNSPWKQLDKMRALSAKANVVDELRTALEAAVGDFAAPCPHCQGKMKIPGSRNWVAQGFVEADCWHCGATGKAVNLPWYAAAQAALAKAGSEVAS